MNFSQFIFRRTLMVIPLLVGVVFLTFMLVRVGGLDPVGLLAGPTATAEEFDMIRKELGLDQPLWKQFLIYAGNVVQGDLGESWLSNRPVLEDISSRSLISLELLFWGIGLGTLIGVPLGCELHLILMAVLTKPHVLCRCLDFQFRPIGLALSCCLSSSIC